MEIQRQGRSLTIKGVRELDAASAKRFQFEIYRALPSGLAIVELDLADVADLDSIGLGALVSLYCMLAEQKKHITVRIVNLQPAVQQVVELTRLNNFFEIIPGESVSAESRAHALHTS